MTLNINNQSYTCMGINRNERDSDIHFKGVTPEPEGVSGVLAIYRDDGFPLCEVDSDDYAYKIYRDGDLIVTNEPEPPEPEPTEPSADDILNLLLGVTEND